ncbi:hypothetical protein PVK06_012858 [Gossypium arboreum]|uniref:NAC domain-containing protein n=1 Tax=Gossypium arboreum TaxID=29729 RepID=A0ABR0QDL8_GOSAR|nr:hypothetical protein PVK06_012858 [Gossypium arboreum]
MDSDYQYDMMFFLSYRFIPTNEKLITCYLSKKVNGEPLPCDYIPDFEIYKDKYKEPWKIFRETADETFYVFTKLTKKVIDKESIE